MRHFVALLISHCLGQRAAGTNPSAVCAFAPAPDHRGDEHKSLDKTDHEPPGERRIGEDVVDHERPGEDESVGAPVSARMSPIRPLMGGVLLRGDVRLEEMIGDGLAEALIEPAVVTEIRQDDFGQEKKRHHLHEHEHARLQRDIRRATPANPRDPKNDNASAVSQGVIEGSRFERDRERAEQGGTICRLRLEPAAERTQNRRHVFREWIQPGLGEASGFPGVNEDANREENSERDPAPESSLTGDRNAGAPEELERRFPAEHGEDDIVR